MAEVWVFPALHRECCSAGRRGTSATSGRWGRFRLTVPAPKDAQTSDLPWAIWATHAEHGLGRQTFTRQSLAKAKDVPLAVKLAAPGGATVRVLGPNGGAVTGAKVLPMMVRVDSMSGAVIPKMEVSPYPLPDELAERLAAMTGPDGRGTIAAVAPADLAGVVLEAPGFGRQLALATPDSDGGFVFRLAPVGRLAGRIVVDDPRALQGLKLQVLIRSRAEGSNVLGARAEVVPDSSGRFEVPALPVGNLHINVQVPENSKLKFTSVRNKSIEARRLTEVTITEQKAAKTRTLAGRVVDTKGNPVAGATVFQFKDAPARTETTSDAEGRFSLSGVAEASTFVFARAKGFRFAGRGAKAGVTEMTLTLTREGERPAETMHTLAPSATPEQELAAAHRLIDAYATNALEKGNTSDKVQVLEVLARIDPARTLELTGGEDADGAVSQGHASRGGRHRCCSNRPPTRHSPLRSRSTTRRLGPSGPAQGGRRPFRRPRRRRSTELLRPGVGSPRRPAREPAGIKRMLRPGQVAEHWLDMGLTEKGKALLREIQPDAEQLPDVAWPSYAKGAFAEELSQIDPDAALKLTERLSDAFEFDRHHGNIAHELAGKDPAAAERVLGMVKDPYQHDQYVVRVVHRMAAVDLARARRLAATAVDPVMRGYAFGMGALGLAKAKKTADATAQLREAMDILGTAGEYGASPTRSPCDRASTCAALVAVAERIDPNLVAETFWRALSLRNPRQPDSVRDPSVFLDLRIALLLARFDRDVARSQVGGAPPRPGGVDGGSVG